MTPEKIRAEAIARVVHELRGSRAMPGATQQQYELWATRMVDALGDMLPTAEEISTCFPDEPAADDETMRRYVTAWREVAE